jgi:hypothetical protein
MVEFGEPDHVSATAAPIAVEKVALRIDQEARLVILVQGTQPHPAAAGEGPSRAPILRLEISHERKLMFQVVESLSIHGLLASIGRIRQTAGRSQATMVGDRKK